MEGIQIYELKRMDLRGATVIDGFPSVGLVSSIVANYLINALNLTQIGIMDSVYFPTVALVRDGQPMNPVRIYAGPKMDDRDQIVVFISEFQPPPNLIKGIAATVLDWAQDARCNLLVCPEGLIVDAREDEAERQVEVYGIGSTDKTMDMIRKNNITVFEEGVITGVAGVLLNEGRKRDFDVITLLSEAHPDYPDARAAARAIEVIDKLLLHTELDARPLYEEAERNPARSPPGRGTRVLRPSRLKCREGDGVRRVSFVSGRPREDWKRGRCRARAGYPHLRTGQRTTKTESAQSRPRQSLRPADSTRAEELQRPHGPRAAG